jgi:hypothetical protein
MAPHRKLSVSSHRKPKGVQEIFLGLATSLAPPDPSHPDGPRKLDYSCVLHDGSGVVGSENFTRDFTVHADYEASKKEVGLFVNEVLKMMRDVQTHGGMNVSTYLG